MVKIDDAIPAIVDKETFEKVQQRLESNKYRCRSHTAKRRVFLLSGLIHCAVCGGNYISHLSRSKGHEYTYYVCRNRYGRKKKQPDGCLSVPVRGEELEKFVISAVKSYLTSETDFTELAQHVANRFNSSSVDVSAEKKELSGVDAKISNGIQAILSGFDAPELRQQIESLKSRRATLMDTINSAKKSARRINVAALAELLQADTVNLDSNNDEVVRAVIRRHVPYISANADGSFTISIGYVLSQKGYKKTPIPEGTSVAHSMAGAVRIELTTYGFGDRCSTN